MLALDPAGLAGFFYHPRLLAVVHLITLGWLTSSLLGLFHLAAPRLLGRPFRASRSDVLVFVLFFLGSTGIIGHFWIGEMSGVGWSGVLVALVVFRIGVRFLVESGSVSGVSVFSPGLFSPGRKHFTRTCLLALLNMVGAAILGISISLDRYVDVLPGFVLHHVFAHAHLAVLGWTTLLMLGFVRALLTDSAPSESAAEVVAFEVAVLALVLALLANHGHGPAALAMVVAVFLLVQGMGKTKVPWWIPGGPARSTEKCQTNVELQQAFFYLGVTCVLGVGLAFLPGGALKLKIIVVYGTTGLLGFLGALPFALLRSFEGAEGSYGKTLGRWFWGMSVPLLAVGFSWEFLPALRFGGIALVVAAVVAWRGPWLDLYQEPRLEGLSLSNRSTPSLPMP
jgi:hypothetical protein